MPKLEIPPSLDTDQENKEIARLWICGERPTFVIEKDVWDDPFVWGVVIVDLMRHIAMSYGKEVNAEHPNVLSRIRKGFDAEWENPTD